MNHAPEDKNISQYNSFEIFEDIYGQDRSEHFNQLEMPEIDTTRSSLWFWLSLLLLIVVIGLTIHPLLSYLLKTPYPLMVIGEDSMQPVFKKNDLVVVKGVVNTDKIDVNDVIVYQTGLDKNYTLTVNRVQNKDENSAIVKGDATSAEPKIITLDQIVGQVISSQGPIKLPLVGVLGALFNK
ncbi:hypothetical protein CO134_02155 [Candidatus Kuenenbacteria bacterium CG_4_9_14_3_um_filter_39_14]|uniref:Signal peptidase I n=2 Tax=Candidatus Kueneniibacteriota TaxID=1752740 RepID=A0A2M7Z936_9BACT|nr:hypothetical protein [Candidatus Kuenenbacteria bacterium]PJA92049.1 MAG: hypothetical protein CO134_02155 [Candidatus Kuenenbacteria bacterium CG_4_9_14_3_um_filter_39_14]